MKGKSCYHFPMGRLFNSATATMKRMYLFIKVGSSMTWRLMRLGNGRKTCFVSCLAPTGPLKLELIQKPYLREIQVVLVTLGSNGYSLNDALMKESTHKITRLFRLWSTTMKLLWRMTRTMSGS